VEVLNHSNDMIFVHISDGFYIDWSRAGCHGGHCEFPSLFGPAERREAKVDPHTNTLVMVYAYESQALS